ncbi:hypothetical protein B0H13DRAFT_2488554, partial [Mycena leptocephala]
GKLISVRYRLGDDGRRYALSCVIEAPNTVPDIIPELPKHHVVSLRDTTSITLEHPHSKGKVTVKRTQLPILPAFAITAHKAQGKTLTACVVNFTGCRGTESPYVMVSRATSLDSLVNLNPFPKEVICCRQSQDMRVEFRRVRYLSLKVIQKYGSPDEVARASSVLRESYRPAPMDADPPKPMEGGADAVARVNQIQANAVLMGPVNRRLALSAPIPGSSSVSSASTSCLPANCKRRLDDATPNSRSPPKKRKHNQKPPSIELSTPTLDPFPYALFPLRHVLFQNFVVPDSLLPFEPLIIGTVRDLYDMGQGVLTVESSLPRHATNSMDAMFWNQVACLVGTVRQCPCAPTGVIFKDILEWSTDVSYSSFEADDMRIFIEIDPSVTVVRSTPLRLFEALTVSPTISSASSSTLSSDGCTLDDVLRIRPEDLLVLQCELHCTDFFRPSSSSVPSAIRVFAIRASHVEILV